MSPQPQHHTISANLLRIFFKFNFFRLVGCSLGFFCHPPILENPLPTFFGTAPKGDVDVDVDGDGDGDGDGQGGVCDA